MPTRSPWAATLRLTVLATALGGVVLSAGGGCGGGGSPPPSPGPTPPTQVRLVPVASGLAAPVFLTHAGDGSGRRFLLEQPGRIRILDAAGTLLATPFLDLTSVVVPLDATYDERGILGLAFHPDFETNGRFFVRYSAPRTGVVGDSCTGTPRGCDATVLSEFHVAGDPATTDVADAGSEQVLLSIDKPQFNHNGGQVAFGPDGMLYLSLGDGGGAHDGLADATPSHGPIGNGQDLDVLLGKVLRIDVDGAPTPGLAYRIPPDNPFVGVAGADEIWAYGFRNPYRFSFDDRPGGTGALYLGDVGQNLFEELNLVVRGGNYGWARREGTACFDPFSPDVPPASCPTTGLGGDPLLAPVLTYTHADGLAIVGGHVYRGAAVPALATQYVFGDFSQDFGATGRLFHCATTGLEAFVRKELVLTPPGPLGLTLLGIGQDEAGELYVLASPDLSPLSPTGVVLRIDAP